MKETRSNHDSVIIQLTSGYKEIKETRHDRRNTATRFFRSNSYKLVYLWTDKTNNKKKKGKKGTNTRREQNVNLLNLIATIRVSRTSDNDVTSQRRTSKEFILRWRTNRNQQSHNNQDNLTTRGSNPEPERNSLVCARTASRAIAHNQQQRTFVGEKHLWKPARTTAYQWIWSLIIARCSSLYFTSQIYISIKGA